MALRCRAPARCNFSPLRPEADVCERDFYRFVGLLRHRNPRSIAELGAAIEQHLNCGAFGHGQLVQLVCSTAAYLSRVKMDGFQGKAHSLLAGACLELVRAPGREVVQAVRAITHLSRARPDYGTLLTETGLLAAASARLSELCPRDVSRCAWCFAVLMSTSPVLLDMAASAAAHIHEYSSFAISNLAWSLAKIGGQNFHQYDNSCRAACSAFFNAIPEAALAQFDASDLAGLAWALGTSSCRPGLMRALSAEALLKMVQLEPAHLVNICWSIGKLKLSEDTFLQAAASLSMTAFSPDALVSISWAFARASPKVFGSFHLDITKICVAKLDMLSPKSLCNLLWVLAKERADGTAIGGQKILPFHLEALTSAGQVASHRFTTQDVCSFLWAMAALVCVDKVLVKQLGGLAGRNISNLEARQLAMLSWAIATLKSRQPFLHMVPAQALAQVQGGRDLANIVWALAHAGATPGRPQPRAWQRLAEKAASTEDLTGQGLANVAWACAIVSMEGSKAHRLLFARVAGKTSELQLRDAANIAWSLVMLRSRADDLHIVLSRACALLRPSLGKGGNLPDATSVLALLWAEAFAGRGQSGGNGSELYHLGKAFLQLTGRTLDSGHLPLIPTQEMAPGEPSILLNLSDRMVLYKPHGWEVDQATSESAAERLKLSSFVRSQFTTRQCPILKDAGHLHGFLHRLDLPSSGLLLTAKSYEAFYDLMLQLHTGVLVRDYVVLCHGWLSPSCREIDTRIAWSNAAGSGPPSRAQNDTGKPAVTKLRVLAHAIRTDDSFSLVGIRIATGRRHQIRAHLAHIGHPVVCDGKYGRLAHSKQEDSSRFAAWQPSDEQFRKDREWCPRNFLHRYRLAFTAQERPYEVLAPLPKELLAALSQLSPREDASELQLQGWLLGNAVRDWAELPVLPVGQSESMK
ncbi:unnamed protein product [Effrenium voratum]|nr:unnamed protein product [Effrenium voratum]